MILSKTTKKINLSSGGEGPYLYRVLVLGLPCAEGSREARAMQYPFLQALVERHPGGRLLLVTHAGPIKAIACAALGAPVAGQRIWTANGSISRVKWDGEGLALLGLNDRCHLAGEGER